MHKALQQTLAGRLSAAGPIAACALLVSLPLFLHGPSCGHDFDFHLQSWFAASGAWHAGSFGLVYPHWVPAANYGAGEPRFVFYPPFSWMLGALLGTVLPWTLVPQALTLLAVLCCGLTFYKLARVWVRGSVAVGAACVYLANPYLLFVAYERTAYGELLAAVTLPLVLLYTLRQQPSLTKLALVMAALWLTNAPAAVMACYLLALCAASIAVATRSILPLMQAAASLTLGIGLAGVYVLPAWYEQRWVEITRAVGPGMRVEDSFLFGHSGEPFHDQVLHTASWLAIAILGAGMLCSVVAWTTLLITRRTEAGAIPVRSSLPARRSITPCALLTAILAGILLLLLPLSGAVWRHAPELRFLQFPWRWLLVGSPAAVLAAAIAVEALLARAGVEAGDAAPPSSFVPRATIGLTAIGVTSVLCAGAWYAGHSAYHRFGQSCDEEDNVAAQELLIAPPGGNAAPGRPSLSGSENPSADPAGFEGTDEYTPAGADNGEVQQGLPAIRLLLSPEDDEGDDAVSPNPVWAASTPLPGGTLAAQQDSEHKHFTVTTDVPRYAVLRLMDYPAWLVSMNGRPLAERPHREDGLLTIPIPRGANTVDVRYHATPDVYAGRALSLLSLAALGGWGVWSRGRRLRDTAPAPRRGDPLS